MMRPKGTPPITGLDGVSEHKMSKRLTQIVQVEAIAKSGFEGGF